MKFRNRLLISYLVLILLPLIALGTLFYLSNLRIVREQAMINFHEIVRKNNEVLDTKLMQIEHGSRALFVDQDMFEIFEQLDPKQTDQLLTAERKITAILNKYFTMNEEIFTAQLWTTYFNFGIDRRQLANSDEPWRSTIYRTSAQKGGQMVWSPTFDFTSMFDLPWLAEAQIDYKYMFSASRLLNLSYLDSSTLRNLSPEIERPVLTILFKANIFRTLFEESIPLGAEFMVLDTSGLIVAHSDEERVTTQAEEGWVKPLLMSGMKSGTRMIKQKGQPMIVVFDRSKVTGWLSVVVVPQSLLIRDLVRTLLTSILLFAAILGILAAIMAFLFSAKIMVPVKKLMVAMRFAGEGDFHTRVESTSHDEFGIMLQKFNTMNNRIGRLVEENYEIKLKEKEAEIMALNMQMNPHFLYNTLNVINWMAIENGQKEVSKSLISLSNMLHYTTRKDWSEVPLTEELDWMRNYFFIMSLRFDDRFTVRYDIEPELFAYMVPRLLFQPFVENAILHGFDQLEQGGLILISGRMVEGSRCFEITDNGKGMSESQISQLLEGDSSSIGFHNTLHRIRILYGPTARIDIRSALSGGCTISLVLPTKAQE